MQTSIFVQEISSIDFCFIGSALRGMSLSFDVKVGGSLREDGMLIDFSELKDEVRSFLSSFDHKLLVSKNLRMEENQAIYFDLETSFALKTPGPTIVPFSSLFSEEEIGSFSLQDVFLHLEKNSFSLFSQILSKKLKAILVKKHKNITEVFITALNSSSSLYYLHSLPCHKGICQRFHGHTTKVSFVWDLISLTEEVKGQVLKEAQNYLNGHYFIAKNYSIPFSQSYFKDQFQGQDVVSIAYTGTEGDVEFILPRAQVLFLSGESTIENIHGHLMNHLLSVFGKEIAGVEVALYEGLRKGVAACLLSS